MQKITPFLWFDKEAAEAARFYSSVFKQSRIKDSTIFNNTPSGQVEIVTLEIDGFTIQLMSAGPMFRFNPSISLFAVCETEAEIDAAWQLLSSGGKVVMPLHKYDWSEKYGWLSDKYGLSWQLFLGKISDVGQKITPFLMFVGKQHGRAEEALRFYSSVFPLAHTDGVLHFGSGEAPEKEGTVKHAQFALGGCKFMAMDSALQHDVAFNEAVSFVIDCRTQQEVDYYWEKLSSGGGEESMCGWLKDKFGVSWQVVPTVLNELLRDEDPGKAQRAMQAMLQMRKIDIEALRDAANRK